LRQSSRCPYCDASHAAGDAMIVRIYAVRKFVTRFMMRICRLVV
jgi:hypothetical protein